MGLGAWTSNAVIRRSGLRTGRASLRAVNCWSYRALAFLRMGAGGYMHGLDGGLILVDHSS